MRQSLRRRALWALRVQHDYVREEVCHGHHPIKNSVVRYTEVQGVPIVERSQ
jgi:hypothetical protein